MPPTLYVITYYDFNHHLGRIPIDARFVRSKTNIIYYLIDQKKPSQLRSKPVLFESQLDPALYKAGATYFAEWSFLLSEYKHAFCQYPFFMVSSRFYEKNTWLPSGLDQHWDRIFDLLKQYGWGYLPSYDRSLEWQDLNHYRSKGWLPVTQVGRNLVIDKYGISIPEDYAFMSDFMCNFIGFYSRDHLMRYIKFYLPIIDSIFDEEFRPKVDIGQYVEMTRRYRKEKPFTFYLELISHLFFYSNDLKFFGLHYDGFYEVDERHAVYTKLSGLAPVLSRTGAQSATDYEWYDMEGRLRAWAGNSRWSPFRPDSKDRFVGAMRRRLGRVARRLGRA